MGEVPSGRGDRRAGDAGGTEGGSPVAADDAGPGAGRVGLLRLVPQYPQVRGVEFELDLVAARRPDDLPGQRHGAAVPQRQRFP